MRATLALNGLNIILLLGCSIVEPPIIKSTNITKNVRTLAYDDYNSKFELITKDVSLTVHH